MRRMRRSYVGGDEGGEFLGREWILIGGNETFEDGYFLKGDSSLGGIWGGLKLFLKLSFYSPSFNLLSYSKLFTSIDHIIVSSATSA